ncbi:GNAT family N-acetyltransferase [Paenibacillus sp. 598K]|uniref:GNAT family N-acetyltransferase n=1 Tax=Paenibacillus sp. 598K TaxID=1117987 RepID=UPI000FF9FFE9|nr:GNAT family N-acetyltransferase [Paenibacillus sp. 598K]GBF76588.1 GNAT family N-acetyltransferase [Paenibacillus sp. 598K]
MAEFRLATLADGPQLLDLSLRAYEPIRQLGIHFAAATADLALVEKNLTNNMCLVMEEEGRIVSTISVRMPWGPQPGPYGVPHLWWFASDPDANRKGIGREMITWCEETMLRDTLKTPAVSLGTADKHPWLIEMYERRGYEIQGSKDLGRGHITIFMKKILIPEFRA